MARRLLADGVIAADAVASLLTPGCSRIEVAGSVRRRNVDCKDLELVAIPGFAGDLFGGRGEDLLNQAVFGAVRSGSMAYRNPRASGSEPSKAYDLDDRRYYPLWLLGAGEPWAVDLFVVRPPAQWGAIFAIRTGPADYAKRLVTGCQIQGLRCVEGHLVDGNGADFDTPEERDFIEACGFVYVPAEHRW